MEERVFTVNHHTYLSNNICYLVLKVLSHIDSIMRSPRAPPLIYRCSKGPVQNGVKESRRECGFEHLPLAVEMWADQLMALKVTHYCPWLCSPFLICWPPFGLSLYVRFFLCVAFAIAWLGVKILKIVLLSIYIPPVKQKHAVFLRARDTPV